MANSIFLLGVGACKYTFLFSFCLSDLVAVGHLVSWPGFES